MEYSMEHMEHIFKQMKEAEDNGLFISWIIELYKETI